MHPTTEAEATPMKKTNPITSERTSDRELVVTRIFDAPPRLVFEAWTKPELFQRWWVPKSCPIKLLSYEADVRAGGTYRLVFATGDAGETMAFFGKYVEVTPCSRLVWTNDEGDAGVTVTTVTFEERDGKTVQVMTDLHPSKEALDEAIASGATSGTCETFEQLEELLAAQATSARSS